MTEPVKAATISLTNDDPLTIGKRARLAVKITSEGYERLDMIVPLGNRADALMGATVKFEAYNIRIVDDRPTKVVNKLKKNQDWKPNNERTLGFIYLSFSELKKVEFTVDLGDFIVAGPAGIVEIRLSSGDGSPPVATVHINKIDVQAKIRSFTANQYFVDKVKEVVLSWELDAAGSPELYGPTRSLIRSWQQEVTGSQAVSPRDGSYKTVFTLKTEIESRDLTLFSYGEKGFKENKLSVMSASDGKSPVLGVYAPPPSGVAGTEKSRGLLCLLVQDPKNPATAGLYATANGFDANPETWVPLTVIENEQKVPLKIPVDVARRPGVIFRDKLWLMGGDCCHPDRSGSGVAYYDFQTKTFVTVATDVSVGEGDTRSWPTTMDPRMGHAVLVVPFLDRIWVMGGWRQDGGALNDVWSFDGEVWEEVKPATGKSWSGGCLFGATATSNAVWTVGGFSSPGEEQYEGVLWRYAKDGKEWIKIPVEELADTNLQYCTSALFTTEEHQTEPYFLGVYKKGKTYSCRLYQINSGSEYSLFDLKQVSLGPASSFYARDYSSVQACLFGGAVFFRSLTPNFDEIKEMNDLLIL
jgi:hypothetical protein